MYADMTLVALRNVEPLLENHQLLFACEVANQGEQSWIPHGWMASARRHPFWIFALAQIVKSSGGDMSGYAAVIIAEAPESAVPFV